jgi:hypothetical protein
MSAGSRWKPATLRYLAASECVYDIFESYSMRIISFLDRSYEQSFLVQRRMIRLLQHHVPAHHPSVLANFQISRDGRSTFRTGGYNTWTTRDCIIGPTQSIQKKLSSMASSSSPVSVSIALSSSSSSPFSSNPHHLRYPEIEHASSIRVVDSGRDREAQDSEVWCVSIFPMSS